MMKNMIASKKGSIMIWTILLGFTLTTVFFFFAVRQRLNVEIQRETAHIQATRTFVNDLMDYLRDQAEKKEEVSLAGEGWPELKASVSQNSLAIYGFADYKKSETFAFSDEIFIEWNHCDDKGLIDPGDLFIAQNTYPNIGSNGKCAQGGEFDNRAGPFLVPNNFELKTLNYPFRYRITSKDNSGLKDKRWYISVEQGLDRGRFIRENEVLQVR